MSYIRFLARRIFLRFTALQPGTAFVCGELLFRLLGRRSSRRPTRFSDYKAILVVRLDEIGDFILCAPLLRELRRAAPQARITLVVKPSIVSVAELCPYVDEIIGYDVDVSAARRPLLLPWRAFQTARRRLWRSHFDLAILPRWDTDNCYAAFLGYWSGATRRAGFSEQVNARKQGLNRGFDRLLTDILDDRTLVHETAHNLDLLRFLGAQIEDERLEFWRSADDDAWAARLLSERGLKPSDTLVAFGPSGGHSVLKQWPLEHFIELGQSLQAQNLKIIVVGGPDDMALGEAMEQALGPALINAVGKTTLRQMAALLQRCQCYVGNDSGPMHVAVSVGTSVVALFGSSCPHRYGPWGQARTGAAHTVVTLELACSPCRQGHARDRCRTCIFSRPECLYQIKSAQVQKAVEAGIAGRRGEQDSAVTHSNFRNE